MSSHGTSADQSAGAGFRIGRRMALLEDNQQRLEYQTRALVDELPALLLPRACAAMIIGSVARGRAGDRSDVDLLVVLHHGTPVREDYRWWDMHVAPNLSQRSAGPFPINPLLVARTALTTRERNLRESIDSGLVLWDPEGLFSK